MAVIGTVALRVTTGEINSVRARFGKVEGLRGVALTILDPSGCARRKGRTSLKSRR